MLSGMTVLTIPIDPVVAQMRPSATLHTLSVCAERRARGLPVYNWGLGENPLPSPAPLVRALREHAHRKEYTPVSGLPVLAQRIAEAHGRRPEHVVVAPGLKELIYGIQQCFGGEILHVAPYWVSYAEQTKLLGKRAGVLQTRFEDGHKLLPSQVDAYCRDAPDIPRMILFNDPCNPTGQTYSSEELSALAKVFRRHQIFVFADEVYLGNRYDGSRHSLADHLPELTIRGTSLSKEFACGGDRLGWCTFPVELGALAEAMQVLGTSTYSCGPTPQQYEAVEALNGSAELDDYLLRSRTVFRTLGAEVARRFGEVPGVQVLDPQHAWYLWMKLDRAGELRTGQELVERLIHETGNVMIAAEAFGMPAGYLGLRASFIDFDGEAALKNPEDLTWAAHLFEGIDRFATFLDQL
jgi:aspartate aminotransferase